MTIKVTDSGLIIGQKRVPLLSGSMHYWRIDRANWEKCLSKVKALGFGIVCTYVPWSVHEVQPGEFDFGEIAQEKDLGAFIRLAHSLGLYVMVRPGPHINAEITDFGFPTRILDNPRIQACGPEGEPIILPAMPKAFPTPSYCSEKLWEQMGIWFDAASEIIRPHLYPKGPIILVQCDNEMSFFFRTGAYEQDYSDGAIEAYRLFLQNKYEDTRVLSSVYGRKIETWNDIAPPVDFEGKTPVDLPYYLDWAQFREHVIGDALVRIRGMWADRGIDGVLFTHNIPTCAARTPFNIPRDEKNLDIVGVDFYPGKKDYPIIKDRIAALEGQTRFPWSPEFTSGAYHLWQPISLDDQKFVTMTALMHGLKGFNFYMLVERERWYGSPIKRHGDVREEYFEFYRDLLRFIEGEKLFELEKDASSLVLTPRLYDRLEKTATVLGHFSPMPFDGMFGAEAFCTEDALGFNYRIQFDHDRMRRAFVEGLDEYGATHRWGDSQSGLDPMRRHQVVFCPSFEFMENDLQKDLASYLEMGGTVVMGPEIPARGSAMQALSLLSEYVSRPVHKLESDIDTFVFNAGAGRLILVSQLLIPGSENSMECVRRISNFLRIPKAYPVSAPCERTVFNNRSRTVLFVANPRDEEHMANISVSENHIFEDLKSGERFFGQEEVRISMRPWHIRVLEKIPC